MIYRIIKNLLSIAFIKVFLFIYDVTSKSNNVRKMQSL